MVECRNCGVEVDLSSIQALKDKLAFHLQRAEEITMQIEALEKGYCGSYCQHTAEGEI